MAALEIALGIIVGLFGFIIGSVLILLLVSQINYFFWRRRYFKRHR